MFIKNDRLLNISSIKKKFDPLSHRQSLTVSFEMDGTLNILQAIQRIFFTSSCFGIILVSHLKKIYFTIIWFAIDQWWWFNSQDVHMVHIVDSIRFWNDVNRHPFASSEIISRHISGSHYPPPRPHQDAITVRGMPGGDFSNSKAKMSFDII